MNIDGSQIDSHFECADVHIFQSEINSAAPPNRSSHVLGERSKQIVGQSFFSWLVVKELRVAPIIGG